MKLLVTLKPFLGDAADLAPHPLQRGHTYTDTQESSSTTTSATVPVAELFPSTLVQLLGSSHGFPLPLGRGVTL